MLRFVLFSFLTIPIRNLRVINDIDFNENLNNVLCSLGTIGYFIPKILKKEKICDVDDDCPLVLRCCQIGKKKYCCSPNNFVKMDLAYTNEHIQAN
mgnify:CR=1 FL=1